MRSLSSGDLRSARDISRRLARGDAMLQTEMDALSAEWASKLPVPPAEHAEQFALVDPHGDPTGIVGPRWAFHLFGLRHRAIQIALATPTGLIVLQRRSPSKADWPGAMDMAVSGHVSELQDGGETGFAQAAWRELAEEIGLEERHAASVFLEGTLTPVGRPYFCLECDRQRNPPFIDAEVRQIFAATLSGEGLARIRFADDEVDGVFLASPEAAWQILRDGVIASGLRYSLPRYLDWLEREGKPEAI